MVKNYKLYFFLFYIPALWATQNELATQLFLAVRDGTIEQVQALLEQGAPVDLINSSSYNALMMACCCWKDPLPKVQLLIRYNANVNLHSPQGICPLLVAKENPMILEYLLLQGAKLTQELRSNFYINRNIKLLASKYNQLRAEALIQRVPAVQEKRIASQQKIEQLELLEAIEQQKAPTKFNTNQTTFVVDLPFDVLLEIAKYLGFDKKIYFL